MINEFNLYFFRLMLSFHANSKKWKVAREVIMAVIMAVIMVKFNNSHYINYQL